MIEQIYEFYVLLEFLLDSLILTTITNSYVIFCIIKVKNIICLVSNKFNISVFVRLSLFPIVASCILVLYIHAYSPQMWKLST